MDIPSLFKWRHFQADIIKDAAYPPAFDALQHDGTLPETCLLRPYKYLHNVVEQEALSPSAAYS